MPRISKMQLPFTQWPAEDQERWNEAFRPGDLFEENRRGTHLSPATRYALRVSYAQYLRFLLEHHPDLLIKAPEARLNRQRIADYVAVLRKTNKDLSRLCRALFRYAKSG